MIIPHPSLIFNQRTHADFIFCELILFTRPSFFPAPDEVRAVRGAGGGLCGARELFGGDGSPARSLASGARARGGKMDARGQNSRATEKLPGSRR